VNIIQTLPFMNIGGVERGVIDLAVYLKAKKIKNCVVSGGGRLVETLEEESIPHHKLAVYRKSPVSILYINKFKKIISENNSTIIHARSRVPAWISFFATRATNSHFITTAHGVYKSKISSEVMAWGKYVICPSKVVARHMKDKFGVDEEKIVIINRWVDLDKFAFTDYEQRRKSEYIVSIGRISPTKGYEHLIKAFKKVVRFYPYLKLKIVGSADKSKMRYQKYLKTLVNRYALNFNVEFVGFRADVENILSGARMLVAPSTIQESFGRVIVEAFSCGVPVVASRVGGYAEIIDDKKNAILVEPGDSSQLSNSMLRVLDEPVLASKLTISARKKVENHYTMKNCLKEIEAVYELAESVLRILVIKISSFGDLILSIPSLKELRSSYPQAKISLLTLKKYHSFIQDCPYVDEVISVGQKYKELKSIFSLTNTLRRRSFDYIIDFQNNRASHFISFLSLPRYSFGFNVRYGFLLSKKVKYDRSLDPLSSQEEILKFLGIKLHQKSLIFWEKKNLSVDLNGDKFIGINVSASQRWQSKKWPTKNTIKLIGLIYKNLPDYRVVFFGDEQFREYAHNISQSLHPHPLNLCGRTNLADLPLYLKKMDAFITPDTATMHLAQSLGVQTLALFGPTNPNRHTVKAKNLHVFSQELECSYCYKPKCKFADESLCLEKIGVGEVFSKIKEIIHIMNL